MNVIKEMEKLCFKDNLSEEEINAIGSCGLGSVYVHKIDNQNVGYYIVLEQKRYIQLVSLGVLPEYRGQGIGRILLEKVKQHLDCQRKRIVGNVNDDDYDSQTFLKHFGFKAYNCEQRGDKYIFEWRQKKS